MLRLSLDHPYHSLSVLLALANASKDDDLSFPTSGSTSTHRLSRKDSNNKKPSSSAIDKVNILIRIAYKEQYMYIPIDISIKIHTHNENYQVSVHF